MVTINSKSFEELVVKHNYRLAHCNVNSLVIRYEREEAFHSLQVTVKNLKLEDSLEQFVNGEILEGDNAYFCEKCNERVSVLYKLH